MNPTLIRAALMALTLALAITGGFLIGRLNPSRRRRRHRSRPRPFLEGVASMGPDNERWQAEANRACGEVVRDLDGRERFVPFAPGRSATATSPTSTTSTRPIASIPGLACLIDQRSPISPPISTRNGAPPCSAGPGT